MKQTELTPNDKNKLERYGMTQNQLWELRSFLVERIVDNMSTKDLVEYVTDDLDQYYHAMGDTEFIDEAKNYWDDGYDDVVEEIKEYTDCDFKKDRKKEGDIDVREQLLNEGFVPHDTDDIFIDINNTGGKY